MKKMQHFVDLLFTEEMAESGTQNSKLWLDTKTLVFDLMPRMYRGRFHSDLLHERLKDWQKAKKGMVSKLQKTLAKDLPTGSVYTPFPMNETVNLNIKTGMPSEHIHIPQGRPMNTPAHLFFPGELLTLEAPRLGGRFNYILTLKKADMKQTVQVQIPLAVLSLKSDPKKALPGLANQLLQALDDHVMATLEEKNLSPSEVKAMLKKDLKDYARIEDNISKMNAMIETYFKGQESKSRLEDLRNLEYQKELEQKELEQKARRERELQKKVSPPKPSPQDMTDEIFYEVVSNRLSNFARRNELNMEIYDDMVVLQDKSTYYATTGYDDYGDDGDNEGFWMDYDATIERIYSGIKQALGDLADQIMIDSADEDKGYEYSVIRKSSRTSSVAPKLKTELVKIGYVQPELRPALRKILATLDKSAADAIRDFNRLLDEAEDAHEKGDKKRVKSLLAEAEALAEDSKKPSLMRRLHKALARMK
jgi:hypothetical protein